MRLSHSKNPYVKIVGIAAILLFAFTRIPTWYQHWLSTPLDPEWDQAFLFVIEQGESGRTVASHLEEQGLIDHEWLFYWYLKQNDLGDNIQAGRFPLSPAMSPEEIAEVIVEGHGELTLTIPEGWTLMDIDERLTKMGLISAGTFSDCTEVCSIKTEWEFLTEAPSVEGYLFPDTYFVDGDGFDSEVLIHRLIGTFEAKFLTEENRTAITASGRPLEEIVIMASIVEREASSDEERSMIAGILWKRYDNDWGLEADATLRYILDDEPLTIETLETDSLYNTRKYRGLPPTAISNPGLASLEAALYPEESSYWYYLHDTNGNIHYAETNEEHNVNKAEFL